MINNFKKIYDNIEFSENEYCYTLILALRLKDKETNKIEIGNSSWEVIYKKPVKNKQGFEALFNDAKRYADILNCRIYISLTPIIYSSYRKLFSDRINNPNFSDENIYDMYGNHSSETIDASRYFLLDIDADELNIFEELKEEIDLFYPNVFYIPTVNGYHIIGSPSDINKLGIKYNIHNKTHDDCRTLLYTSLDRKVKI